MIRVSKEPEGAGPPYERCCFCWRPTMWWHAKKDVAVCPECATTHKTSQIPKKADWCKQASGLDNGAPPMTNPTPAQASVEAVTDQASRLMAAGWRGNPNMSGDDRDFMSPSMRRKHDDKVREVVEFVLAALSPPPTVGAEDETRDEAVHQGWLDRVADRAIELGRRPTRGEILMCPSEWEIARPSPSAVEALPDDVVRLVIAARDVAFSDPTPETIRELDKASEAFADRVPWDDEPVSCIASEKGGV